MSDRARRGAQHRSSTMINVLGVCVASGACIYAILVGTPMELARSASDSLAAASVAISAGVAPNPDNTLAAQLAQQTRDLNTREQALQQKEALLARNNSSSSAANSLGLYSFIASTVLFLLVGLNFYFDRKRVRAPGFMQRALTVDLRRGR